jgi:hypothetical protein
MAAKKYVYTDQLKGLDLQQNIDYTKACRESKYAALLIQHINNAKSLYDMITSMDPKFIQMELIYILFIVYQALALLSKTFTHYDLHLDNVLIYEPFPDQVIQYHYHNEDGTEFSFYSPYIPKIIDYGRSYFDNGNNNSYNIYESVCSKKECNPDCGSNYGLIWLNPDPYLTISSSQKNESHDLRLINEVKNNVSGVYNKNITVPSTQKTYSKLNTIIKKIEYGVGIKDREYKNYGTIENLNISDRRITNVNGLHNVLKKVIQEPEIINENQTNYKNNWVACHLHIYYDQRPMVYEREI